MDSNHNLPTSGSINYSMTELKVDGFKIHSCIQTSVYGGIFKATNNSTSDSVVLKVAIKTKASSEHLSQLRNEFEILQSLTHIDNVPKALNLIEHSDYLALEMADFSGESIATLLEQGTFSVEQSVNIITTCLHALKAIHSLHVIHKDIKPRQLDLIKS